MEALGGFRLGVLGFRDRFFVSSFLVSADLYLITLLCISRCNVLCKWFDGNSF